MRADRFVAALGALILILVAPMPYAAANSNRFPGYSARRISGAPPVPKLLSRVGTYMPTIASESSSPSPLSLVKAVCTFSSSFDVGGVATGSGGQFFSRWDTGSLWFYNKSSKRCTFVHAAPPGGACSAGSNCGYVGIASKGSLVALISWGLGGLWTCIFSSATGKCSSVSAFIRLPGTFCSSTSSGFCNPDGAAFDISGNLWYADIVNGVEVELTATSHFKHVGATLYYGAPIDGVAIDPATGNQWVSDYTCAGDVYENGGLVSQAGDAIGSIALSNLNPSHTTHVYVGVTAACGNYPYAFVGDENDFIILPTPFSSPNPIMGISSQLYFSDFFGHVWLTKDTA
ncbi:MAG TPA: hypothetical protein VEG61_02935 [Candidatus Dormibacteraeota bacterium]|nr:hypothetical protein [Candidatus Dormibacteraeota bacterium]